MSRNRNNQYQEEIIYFDNGDYFTLTKSYNSIIYRFLTYNGNGTVTYEALATKKKYTVNSKKLVYTLS